MGSTLNKGWHQHHVMPKNASIEQRLRWHVAHARACGCRQLPPTVIAELRRRGQTIPRPLRHDGAGSEIVGMNAMLRFSGAVKRSPAIDVWLNEQTPELGAIARRWFARMRKCGDEVRELMHDGCPVACVGDAPFGYVNVFRAHVNVGFFFGAAAERSRGPAGRKRQADAPCETEAERRSQRRSVERLD